MTALTVVDTLCAIIRWRYIATVCDLTAASTGVNSVNRAPCDEIRMITPRCRSGSIRSSIFSRCYWRGAMCEGGDET